MITIPSEHLKHSTSPRNQSAKHPDSGCFGISRELVIGPALSKGWQSGPEAFCTGHFLRLDRNQKRTWKAYGTQGKVLHRSKHSFKSDVGPEFIWHVIILSMLIQRLLTINSAQQRSMIYELGLTLYVYGILGTILLWQKFPVNGKKNSEWQMLHYSLKIFLCFWLA